MISRKFVVLGVSAMLLASGGAAQAATLRSNAPNGTGYAQSTGTNTRVGAYDTKTESSLDTIYALYQRAGDSTVRRLETSGGRAGSSAESAAGATVRTVTGCVNLTATPDQCGAPA